MGYVPTGALARRLRAASFSTYNGVSAMFLLRYARDEAVADVALDQGGIAQLGRAHPAATGQFEDEPVARRDELVAFRAQDRAALQPHGAGCTLQAAVPPTRRVRDPVEDSVAGELGLALGADLHDLAEPAAAATGSAGVRSQLLAPEHDGRDVLRRLHRHGPHTGRERGPAQPVLTRPRPGPARVERDHLEILQRRVLPGDHRPAPERRVPQTIRALRR